MANNLKTGWVIIATSGPTIDGRKIEKKWLTDMAENYSERLYSAKIWPEHGRYAGSQGKVLALKVEPATDPALKDELQLMAIIAPSEDLVYYNKRGRYAHTSIEVLKNFASKGYFYLGGLAVTDEPASLGTTELQFSESASSFYFSGNQLDVTSAEPDTLFKFFKRPSKPDEQDNIMTPEQLAELKQSQGDFAKTMSDTIAIAMGKFTAALEALKPQPDKVNETEKPPADEFVSKKSFDELNEKFTKLSEDFEAAKKTPKGATQPAGDDSGAEKRTL